MHDDKTAIWTRICILSIIRCIACTRHSCARSRLPQHQARRLLAALSPTPLFRTLGSSYVGNADANYGCRVLALQLLLEALRLLSGAAEPAVG